MQFPYYHPPCKSPMYANHLLKLFRCPDSDTDMGRKKPVFIIPHTCMNSPFQTLFWFITKCFLRSFQISFKVDFRNRVPPGTHRFPTRKVNFCFIVIWTPGLDKGIVQRGEWYLPPGLSLFFVVIFCPLSQKCFVSIYFARSLGALGEISAMFPQILSLFFPSLAGHCVLDFS